MLHFLYRGSLPPPAGISGSLTPIPRGGSANKIAAPQAAILIVCMLLTNYLLFPQFLQFIEYASFTAPHRLQIHAPAAGALLP